MKIYLETPRMIVVDGELTKLLATWSNEGRRVIDVSGPRSLFLDEHEVTELGGLCLAWDAN